MRRAPAILLLGIFSFALMAPAVFADAGSKMPACCRRDGPHHCVMPASEGTAIQAVCPAYSKTGAAPAYPKVSGLRPGRTAFWVIAAGPTELAQTETAAHSAILGPSNKRGPPTHRS